MIPEKALERHIAILGKTGSGKSNAAKVIAERLMIAGGRVCVIDPTGTWWGMRLSTDGKKPSRFKPVIFGGNHADIPITGDHGAVIAEAIGTSSTSAIIDTRLFSVGARTKFFTAFGETLLSRNSGALTLIIDEAHLFAPQGRVNDPQSGAMVHAANNLVSLGRGIGLRIVLISQRPAKLHKDSLTQVETLIALRLIAPQDRNAIDDWIGEWAGKDQGKEIMASLSSLPTGTAWVWAPEQEMLEKVKFPLAATFDSGQPTGEQQALAPLDVSAITSRLETIRQDVVANDPARLKRRVADLEKQVAAAPQGVDRNEIGKAEKRGYDKGFEAGIAHGKTVGASLALTVVHNALTGLRIPDIVETTEGAVALPEPVEQVKRPAPIVPETKVSGPPSGVEERILGALRELEFMGVAAPAREIVTFLSGYSNLKSKGFVNAIGALRTGGMIEYPSPGTVSLTSAGRARAPVSGKALTTDAIRDRVVVMLGGAAARILDPLISSYPTAIGRQALAETAGYSHLKSKGFVNAIGRLRTLGFIDYPSTGEVRATDLLFPGGEP